MKSYLKPEEVADMALLLPQKKPNQSQVKFWKWIRCQLQNIIKINRDKAKKKRL
jgi:hypothetical protein